MSHTTTRMLKTALSAMHYTGADRLLGPMTRGIGVIFTLHHVRPEPPDAFEPNRILKVTPEFLDQVVRQVIEAGFEVLSLDEAHARISGMTTSSRPFACFTLDDGYRDNAEHAYPIFKRYGAPFAIYVPTDLPDTGGMLWWLALEHVIRHAPALRVQMQGEMRTFPLTTIGEKDYAFNQIYWWLRQLPDDRVRTVVGELCAGIDFDYMQQCRDLIMTWGEIRMLAGDPLVTIGAHTRRHFALSKLSEAEAADEISGSVRRVESELGRPCRHFSYPYGDAASAGARDFQLAQAAGVATAVTTRKGVIHGQHAKALTALPRISLNGDFQDRRYVKVFLSGVPFALLDMLQPQRRAH
jgi:peptidoglycan/xylan/chitin deacetylase (PgdA/CDA1 family)